MLLGAIGTVLTFIGILLNILFAAKESKRKQALKRISQLASQSQSVCNSLDTLLHDLKIKKIGANSAETGLSLIITHMAALNGDIQNIFNEFKK